MKYLQRRIILLSMMASLLFIFTFALDISESGTLEVSESGALEVSESDALEVSESDALEVSESDALEVSESDALEVSESDALEVSESDALEVSESDALEVPESDALEVPESDALEVSESELKQIALKIYHNETGGKRSNLLTWNLGEDFPSLGIGHFIWYKEGADDIFTESFPELIRFFRESNIDLPAFLEEHLYAPWENRNEFIHAKSKGNLAELEDFLYKTKEQQIIFIYERLQESLPKMLDISEHKEKVEQNFYLVANAKNGLYALIDYVNFKGEGIAPSEQYQNIGWGLLQVLETMEPINDENPSLNQEARIMENFSRAAKKVLLERVKNSDRSRDEKRWLQGWYNRCDSYVSN